MLDVYKFHTQPEQLNDYEAHLANVAAKRRAILARRNRPDLPAASVEYSHTVDQVTDFFDHYMPLDFTLDENEHVVDGDRVMTFTMSHPRDQEVVFKVDVTNNGGGMLILYDIDGNDVIDRYYSFTDAAEDGIIYDKIDEVIAHYQVQV